MRSLLFPFFLIALLAPAAADSVHETGDATGKLVGAFDAELNGHFVDIAHDASGATIRFDDHTVVIEADLSEPRIEGPMADFGTMQVHDNIHHWIHVQASFRMQATTVEEIPRGLRVDGLHLVALDLDWSHDGQWLNIDARDTLISTDGAFQNLGPEPSAWALLQGAGDNAVMDWFAFGGAPFRTTSIGDEVVMDLVGTIGDDAPDVLVRLETDGHFDPRHDRFVFMAGTLAATSATAEDMLRPRGSFSFHARDVGHAAVDLRLPEGLSGQVRWSQDTVAPQLGDVAVRNIDPYVPLHAVPEMVVSWDEPVLAELHVGTQVKQTVSPAYELTFRLTGLRPETTYTYELRVRDLAGNPASHEGMFTTGPRDGPSAVIDVVHVDEETRTMRFTASYDDGTIPAADQFNVIIDKRPAMGLVRADGGAFVLQYPEGSHEVLIELNTATGRISERHTLGTSDHESPGLPLVAVLGALALAARRR